MFNSGLILGQVWVVASLYQCLQHVCTHVNTYVGIHKLFPLQISDHGKQDKRSFTCLILCRPPMYIHTHILYEITRNGSLACMLQGLNTMYASSCQSLVCPVMLSSQTRFRASYVRKRSRLNSCPLQNAHGHCEPSTPAFA